MNGFKVDEEMALDYMTRADMLNAELGGHTVYAVVCHHDLDDGVGSHGGKIVANAREALDISQEMNDKVPADHTCVYVPIAMNLSPGTSQKLVEQSKTPRPDDLV